MPFRLFFYFLPTVNSIPTSQVCFWDLWLILGLCILSNHSLLRDWVVVMAEWLFYLSNSAKTVFNIF